MLGAHGSSGTPRTTRLPSRRLRGGSLAQRGHRRELVERHPLTVLVSDGSGLAPFVTTVDGYRTVSRCRPCPTAVSIAAAPGDRLLAGTNDDRLVQFTSGASWLFVTSGAEPAYPG